MVTFTTFDGHIRNVSNLNTSFYMTFTIAAALELPADLLVAWSINNLGRRWSVACGHFFAGSSMMLCAIFISTLMPCYCFIDATMLLQIMPQF